MLLYDRLVEHWSRESKHQSKVLKWLQLVADHTVYDVSSVVPLFQDWERESNRMISKNPPNDLSWAEWDHVSRSTTERRGCLIIRSDVAILSDFGIESVLTENVEDDWSCVYMCLPYGRIINTTATDLFGLRGRCYVSRSIGFVLMSDDGYKIRNVAVNSTDLKTIASSQLLPVVGVANPLHSFWPPFMAFALLNCKNVVTETHTPDDRTQRRAAKAGCPPRCTYKTLKIEVPATVHKREGYAPDTDDSSGPKVRFHLCRGHFKNLQHDRYKTKGWHWWPAHWKGSADLGTIHKTYKLKAANGGEQS